MDQKQIQDKLERIQREVNQVIRGKENVVERVLAAIISGGHILMEDIPGRLARQRLRQRLQKHCP